MSDKKKEELRPKEYGYEIIRNNPVYFFIVLLFCFFFVKTLARQIRECIYLIRKEKEKRKKNSLITRQKKRENFIKLMFQVFDVLIVRQ